MDGHNDSPVKFKPNIRMGHILFIVCGIAVLVLVVVAAYLNNLIPYFNKTSVVDVTQNESELTVPTGYILLNFTREGEKRGLYILNAATKEVSRSSFGRFMPVAASDEQSGIASAVFTQDDGSKAAGIFRVTEGSSSDNLVYASSTLTDFVHLELSPSGKKYTFSVHPSEEELSYEREEYQPHTWKVYLGDIGGGEPQYVVDSPFALFSPDETKLLYLADDGFHTYEIASGEDTFIPELDTGPILTYIMADLSPDGKKIAITSSPTKEVKIANILSWNPFTIEWTHTFPILAYWPALSPDGNFVALQQFDWVDGHPGNKRLTIIDVQNESISEVQTLNNDSTSDIFVSDWTLNP